MSRLQSHKNKVFTAQVVIAAMAFIFIVIFIFTTGFKMLLNSSLYINQFFNKSSDQKTTTNEKESFQGDFSIDSIPTATNSAKISVSGSVNNYDTLTFYLNKEKDKEIPIVTDSFSIEVGDLKKGDNQVYFLAKSKKFNQEKQSETYNVVYNDDKPKLEISEPDDQLKTNKQEIKVIGKTDKDNTVKINNLPVVVDYQGGFQTSVKLNDGENKINIIVENNFGSSETKTLTVTYQKDY